jgi:hypothetical protein
MELELYNTQTEMIIIGSLWNNTETFAFDYTDVINNKDFHDPACKFFHVLLNAYINEYSTEVTEQKVNMYVSQKSGAVSGYKKYGCFKTIKEFMKYSVSSPEEMKRQVDTLKKWSVLRALDEDGYSVDKILSHPNFNTLSAEQVASLVRGNVDTICNGTLSNIDDPVSLASNVSSLADEYLDAPEQGYNMCFSFMNSEFLGGCNGDTLGICGLSNSGKGRMLSYILAHLFACEDLTVGLMSNEMGEKSMSNAVLTASFNSKKIQKIHGEELLIPQKRFTSGWYKDANGEIIKRKVDINGCWDETVEEFRNRIERESREYRSVLNVLKWFEDKQKNGKGDFLFKDLCGGYTDQIITRTMRQLALSKNCDVLAYDTCKTSSDKQIDNFADMLRTVSIMSELNKFLDKYLILTLQLNNGALERPIEDIDSSNIAVSSYVFQLLDEAIVFKHFNKEDCDNYIIKTKSKPIELDNTKHYTGVKTIKNRRGSKQMYLLDSDLNLNTWYEEAPNGILLPKPKKKVIW